MYLARLPDDEWQAVDCPPNLALGLVWRQDLCLCGEELIPQDPNDPCGLSGYNPDPNNRHKYIRVSSLIGVHIHITWHKVEHLHCVAV